MIPPLLLASCLASSLVPPRIPIPSAQDTATPAPDEVELELEAHEPGLRFERGPYELVLTGTLMLDFAALSFDSGLRDVVGESEDTTEVRRVELELEAELGEWAELEIEYNIGDEDPDFADFFVEFPHVRLGVMKESFGLEVLGESQYTTFVERALVQALVPPRSLGVQAFGHGEGSGVTWALGAFTEQQTFEGNDEFGDQMITGRVTKLFRHGPDTFTHAGLALSWRKVDSDDLLRIAQKPEVHQAPVFVDTMEFEADEILVGGVELAWVNGPLSLQGEYVASRIDPVPGSPVSMHGVYAYASWFLTGEQRPYDAEHGIFDRLHPLHDSEIDGSGGAWELAARVSHLDLDDGVISGGTLDDVTLGVTWYLSPYRRIMANYVHSWLDDAGEADMFVLRLQIDF